MKKAVFFNPLKMCLQIVLLLAISCFNLGASNVNLAHAANAPAASDSCGQLLADAEAKFLSLLPADGSIPATSEVNAAAAEYIHASKLCYDQIQASNPSATLQTGTPSYIDEGPVFFGNNSSSANFQATDNKWNASTVTFSFMGSGISFGAEGYGNSVAISKLPTFQACFYTKIINAFAAWQAVSNIHFVRVSDNGAAFNASGAQGDIRIAAHAFDGPYGILAHAYFPPPNGTSAAGDLHFDSAENWNCNTTSGGIDIGIVALHEIGHSLGLDHQSMPPTAVMNPTYNPSLTGLQADDINGITSIYGAAAVSAPPPNDNFSNAYTRAFTTVPYTDTLDTRGATPENTDPTINVLCDNKMLYPGDATVWYQYSPASNISVSLDTFGTDYDTYMAVWTGTEPTLSLVGCDDDTDTGYESQVTLNAQGGATYYIEIAQYAGVQGRQDHNPVNGGTLVFNAHMTNIDISVGGTVVDRYYLGNTDGARRSYDNVDNGPVQITSTIADPLVASQRINLKKLPDYSSYTEFMGLPASKLTDTYIFPWYNNASAGGLSSQLRFGNVGNAETNVTVKVGSTSYGPYHLGLNGSQRVTLDNVDAGPVQVKSSGGVPIIASMRINLKSLPNYSSYTEFMGVSASATVGTKYMFPWYSNLSTGGLESQLRFGNIGNAETDVTVKVGGTAYGPYHLGLNGSQRVSLPDVDAGPVEVTSSGGVPIIASMRVNLKTNPTYSSYAEFMGLPGTSLTETRYLFPWYNNASAGGLSSQLRFGNVGGSPTDVTVKIGGTTYGPYHLGLNGSQRITLDNVDAGPVEVSSSGGVPIIASMRVNLKTNGIYTSYSEFMGLSVGAPLEMPGNDLSTGYWFPWYNNATAGGLSSQLRFSRP